VNILRTQSTPTVATVNLVNGSAFEYPQQPSQVSLGLNANTTGTFATIYAGSRLIAEEFALPVTAVANRYPIIPDDFFFNFVILPGERLVVSHRNPTGGAIQTQLAIDMQPIG